VNWPVTSLVLGVLVACCACQVSPAPHELAGRKGPAVPAGARKSTAPQLGRPETLKFTWQDVNTRKVVGRKGDTFTLDTSVKPTGLRLTITIDGNRLAEVIDSFGYPDSWREFSYRTEQERREKQEELGRKLKSRGFELVGEDGIRVDYSWVVAHSRRDMGPVAEGMVAAARDAGYADSRAFSGGVTSFVQSLEYRRPAEVRKNGRGERINSGGVTMPLETLVTRAGDCDTKALLLASILANVRGAGILLLEGNDHVFVGLRMPPRAHDRYVRVQGIEYVLVEVSTPWPLGSIPESVMAGLARSEFRVVRVE